MLLAFWNFNTILNGLGTLNAENWGSVDQRAAKLKAIKLWEWFDPGRARIRANCTCNSLTAKAKATDFFFRPPTLTDSDFAALWPTDPIFTAIKFLNV